MDDSPSKLAQHPALAEMQILTLKYQRDELLTALKECFDDMQDWASYTVDYFREKHCLQRDIDKYSAIIAKYEASK